jgi:hypothetical protein
VFGSCDLHGKYDSFILWTNGTLSRQIQQLKAYTISWNPRRKFLVVMEMISEVPILLEKMKQWNVLNVARLVPADSIWNTSDL